MYPPALAEQLRERGHDEVVVTERAELRSLSDIALFALAQQEGRAVFTGNIADFVPIADAADQRGETHYGLVLADPAKYTRGAGRTVGRLIHALDELLSAHPAPEPTSARRWL
jgi:Domain of unknown function (DUF5615)